MVKKKLKMTEKKVHIFFKNFAERVYHSQKYINVSYYSIIREKHNNQHKPLHILSVWML